jgi:hypothetical protein
MGFGAILGRGFLLVRVLGTKVGLNLICGNDRQWGANKSLVGQHPPAPRRLFGTRIRAVPAAAAMAAKRAT